MDVLDDPLDLISDAATRISALARTQDLATPAPRLGRWTSRDVVAHLGGVHRWAARIVATGSRDGPGFVKSKLRGVDLCDWFDEGAVELVDTLRSADPSGPCPNFNPGSPSTNAFWVRRQVHETIVHAYDIERSLASPTAIPPDVAADGVEEFLDVFVRTRGKQTLTDPLRLTSTDRRRTWTLAPAVRPGRIDVDSDDQAVAEISGPAMELLLVMWGRIGTSDPAITVTGDRSVAASFRPPD